MKETCFIGNTLHMGNAPHALKLRTPSLRSVLNLMAVAFRMMRGVLIVLSLICLLGCSGVITGASMVYDRHSLYKKVDDYQLFINVNNAIMIDKLFRSKNCQLDVTVFNGDVLLVGHLPTEELQIELQKRLRVIRNYRRFFNKVQITAVPSNSVQDSWLTTKIRSRIFADSSIDPNSFKIITIDGVVYLMGDVRVEEGNKVINIAKSTEGVIKVVTLLKFLGYVTVG